MKDTGLKVTENVAKVLINTLLGDLEAVLVDCGIEDVFMD